LGRSPGGGGTAGECCRCCDSEEAPGLGCSSPGNGLGKGKAVHFWSHFLRRNKACETLARKKSCPFDFVVGFSTGRPWNSAIYDRLWPFSGRNPPNKRQRSVQRTHCQAVFVWSNLENSPACLPLHQARAIHSGEPWDSRCWCWRRPTRPRRRRAQRQRSAERSRKRSRKRSSSVRRRTLTSTPASKNHPVNILRFERSGCGCSAQSATLQRMPVACARCPQCLRLSRLCPSRTASANLRDTLLLQQWGHQLPCALASSASVQQGRDYHRCLGLGVVFGRVRPSCVPRAHACRGARTSARAAC